MKIQIIQFSATKNKALLQVEKDYEKRLSAYFKLNILTLSASKSDDKVKAQTEEKRAIINKLDKQSYIIALDERGEEIDSMDFAELIKVQRDFGSGKIQFLIGGSHGLHPDIIRLSNFRLSFSKMTFTHEMIRIFLKEQLYRSVLIIAGRRYHK